MFPEQSLQGYVWEDDLSWELKSEVLEYHYQNSETVRGPTTDWLCELAGRHEMLLVIGMTERHPRMAREKAACTLGGPSLQGRRARGAS